MNCCGRQKKSKQRQWRRQKKGTGTSRRARRKWSWRWRWKKHSRGRRVGKEDRQVWQDVHQIQIQEKGAGWRYQGQEGPMRERRELGEGTAPDSRLRAG